MIARDQQSEIPLEAFYMAKAVQKFVPHLSKELMVSEPCALVMLLSAVSQQSSAVPGVSLQDGPDISGEAAGGPGDAGEGAAERCKGVPETRILPYPGQCS